MAVALRADGRAEPWHLDIQPLQHRRELRLRSSELRGQLIAELRHLRQHRLEPALAHAAEPGLRGVVIVADRPHEERV